MRGIPQSIIATLQRLSNIVTTLQVDQQADGRIETNGEWAASSIRYYKESGKPRVDAITQGGIAISIPVNLRNGILYLDITSPTNVLPSLIGFTSSSHIVGNGNGNTYSIFTGTTYNDTAFPTSVQMAFNNNYSYFGMYKDGAWSAYIGLKIQLGSGAWYEFIIPDEYDVTASCGYDDYKATDLPGLGMWKFRPDL